MLLLRMHFVSIHACELGSAGKGDQILWHETIEKIEGTGEKKRRNADTTQAVFPVIYVAHTIIIFLYWETESLYFFMLLVQSLVYTR